MDSFALASANIVAGNDAGAAALEWALGGGVIRFDTAGHFALSGASAEATLDGAPVEAGTRIAAAAGSQLSIGAFHSGRFLYIALRGGIVVPEIMGSRATYLPAHFGGLAGRLLKTGDVLPVGEAALVESIAAEAAPAELGVDYSRRKIRVVRGPQWSLFSEEDRRLFFEQSYLVDRTSDRTGYRLAGQPLSADIGSLPSEAVCPGTIQVPPGGLPIVLMADSPTVGGYAKIGVVASVDLPVLAQLRPGETFQFEESSIEDSQRRHRRAATSLYTLASLQKNQ
jgi:antagonist of KipI